MDYLNNIKKLIEDNIVLKKKNRLYEDNHTLNTYFEIGRLLVDAQGGEKRAKYGDGLIKEWSKILTKEYGRGYDASNLRRMRQLYLVFQNCGPLDHNLTWTNLSIILPLKEESKRNYYINISIKQHLSKRQLIDRIKSNEYERLQNKGKIELITEKNEVTIKDMIKDPIIIKADSTVDKLSEKALKSFILEKLEEFLRELGYGFAFIGSEYKLGKFRCDLLFFNTELNSYVVIELKIRKLMPKDIGQIKLYMNYIDINIKKDYMNNTIGIILTKEGDEIVIKYVTDVRILASTYKLN